MKADEKIGEREQSTEEAQGDLIEGSKGDIISKAFLLLSSRTDTSQSTGQVFSSRLQLCNRTGRTHSRNG